jgi:hypothetical protein
MKIIAPTSAAVTAHIKTAPAAISFTSPAMG